MKKIVLILAALGLSVSMMAQQRGDVSLTGSLLLSGGNTLVATTDSDGQTTSAKTNSPASFQVGAGIGFFVADNVELGLGIFYGLEREKNSNSNSENFYYDATTSLTFKPEVTYHVPISDMFYWSPSLAVGFTHNETDHQVDKETVTSIKLPFMISTGLDILAFEFRPCDCFALGFSFGGVYYNKTRQKTVSETESVKTVTRDFSFGFTGNFTPDFTVKFIF